MFPAAAWTFDIYENYPAPRSVGSGALAPDAQLRDHPSVENVTALGSALIATLFLVAVTILVGTASFHFLVWRRTNLPQGPVRTAADEQMAALVLSCGKWSSLALLLLAGPRAVGVTLLLDNRFSLQHRLAALILRSEWGIGLLAIVAASIVSFIGYVGVGKRRIWGWPLVMAGVALVAVGAGLQGHPADAFSKLTLAPIFDGVHAVGAGGWLGSFFVLVLAERRLVAHTASPWTDPLGAMLERYFGASGALAALVVITGLFSAATHLTSFDDIQGTQYGHLLAGKVGIFFILMTFNEFHRRHAERKARTAERPQLVHSLRFEAGLIGLILALSALLLDASPPGMNEVRSEVFRVVPKGTLEMNDVDP